LTKIQIWQNDKRSFQFTLKERGAFVDIANRDCYLTCKTDIDSSSSLFDAEGTVTVASEGTFQVTINSPETGTCAENAICQVTTIDGDGNRVVYGEFYMDIKKKAK
jgi:hypothetical protein